MTNTVLVLAYVRHNLHYGKVTNSLVLKGIKKLNPYFTRVLKSVTSLPIIL